MMWGYRGPLPEVASLVAGQVMVLGFDPDEPGRLHWLGPGPAAPQLMLVEVTVESNAIQPGTATEATMTVNDAGTYVWNRGHRELCTLRVLYDGQGYKTEVRGDTRTCLLPTHHPRCGECGELWPCRDERLDSEARQLTRELDDQCAHCGEPIGGAWSESLFDGVTSRRYHIAKKYWACRAALAKARASLPGLGEHPPAPRGDTIGDGPREG